MFQNIVKMVCKKEQTEKEKDVWHSFSSDLLNSLRDLREKQYAIKQKDLELQGASIEEIEFNNSDIQQFTLKKHSNYCLHVL